MADITYSGPLLTGHGQATLLAACDEAQQQVAQQGYADIMSILNREIRHPTPYYETQIVVQRMRGSDVIHDRGVIYGGWLEGTSSLNAARRFKGYAAFRRSTQKLDREAPAIVEKTLDRYLARLT
jgi:hypothetical protein